MPRILVKSLRISCGAVLQYTFEIFYQNRISFFLRPTGISNTSGPLSHYRKQHNQLNRLKLVLAAAAEAHQPSLKCLDDAASYPTNNNSVGVGHFCVLDGSITTGRYS